MAVPTVSRTKTEAVAQASWLPMIVIALAQIQMGFNITALTVSMGAIVEAFDTSPTSVGTALVVYSLVVAALVMLGAKIGKLTGPRRMFQVGVILHGLAMALVAFSASTTLLFLAQAIAGLAAAVLVPTLVVMIAVHYKGKQQSQSLGLLGAAQAISSVMAFLIAGFLGTFVGWRWSFGIIVIIAGAVFVLSFRLKTVAPQPGLTIDWIGAALAATAIILLSFGFNNVNAWGLLLAGSGAPFSILGLSPAPLMIILGIVFVQAFFAWLRKRQVEQKPSLLALAVLETSEERNATFAMLIIGALGPSVNFLIPLYIQIVQGRTSLQTSVAVIPYSLAIFAAATLVVRLFDRIPPRQIGRYGFVIVAAGLAMLATTVQNEWETPLVILSLVVTGLGEGALLTLVFNVLVSSSPKELAGDVGALRGTTNNLSTAMGTALSGALAIGVLSMLIASSVVDHPLLPPPLIQQINLDKVEFVHNDDLLGVLQKTTATPEQVAEAVRINTEARLRALKIAFLVLAAVALVAIIPASGLPPYVPGEVPSEPEEVEARRDDTQTARATQG